MEKKDEALEFYRNLYIGCIVWIKQGARSIQAKCVEISRGVSSPEVFNVVLNDKTYYGVCPKDIELAGNCNY